MLSPKIIFPNGKTQFLVKKNPTVLDMGLRFLGPQFFSKRQEQFVNLPDGYSSVHEGENFPGSFMIFKTDVLKQIGGFDERYFLYMEDSDISRSMSLLGKAIFYPDVTVVHSWQRNNRRKISGMFHMLSSMIKYFQKWGWKLW